MNKKKTMVEIPVCKYHGCGNDFILISDPDILEWSEERKAQLVRCVCDRHTGIGADGCIFTPPEHLKMIYFNQDGSRADMCGNGIRCLAAYALDEQLILQNEDDRQKPAVFDVDTLAGVRTIRVLEKDGQRLFEVNMGKPDFDPARIGVKAKEPVWMRSLSTSMGMFPVSSFYMNTIHTVVFTDDNPLKEDWEQIGKAICTASFYPMQTNVNFVEVVDDAHLRAATYERGCGLTLACGTGMCAAAVAANHLGMTGRDVEIEMKKGVLQVHLEEDGTVLLTGPACRILKGIYYYECEDESR